MNISGTIGYGLDTEAPFSVDVQAEAPSVSGLYLKAFLPANTDRSSDRVSVKGAPVPVTIERRYELNPGDAARLEVDVTSGGAGYAMTVTGKTTAQGMSNETLAIELG